jgi:hypothetical protein
MGEDNGHKIPERDRDENKKPENELGTGQTSDP